MGRSKGGMFRHRRADDISADLVEGLLDRNPNVNPAEIDDLIWASVQQTLEQGYNVARSILLQTRIPLTVTAQTVNRNCGSSMTALHSAAHAIMAEQGDLFICGGVEHMGHIPMSYNVDPNPRGSKYFAKASWNMGLTAELLARQHKVTREEQDKFALRSHQLAEKATKNGAFRDELVNLEGHNEDGVPTFYDYDEIIRKDTSLDALAKLTPVFDPRSGTVTAGNASAISDGASCLLVMSDKKARDLGCRPLAKVKAMGVAGVEPSIMGFGPVPAVQKALARCGLKVSDIERWEINEAFAAQSLAVLKGLGIFNGYEESVNTRGGAIALGHPLGCSGARITTTLLNTLKHDNKKLGVATMCIGGGQGIATVFERLS